MSNKKTNFMIITIYGKKSVFPDRVGQKDVSSCLKGLKDEYSQTDVVMTRLGHNTYVIKSKTIDLSKDERLRLEDYFIKSLDGKCFDNEIEELILLFHSLPVGTFTKRKYVYPKKEIFNILF